MLLHMLETGDNLQSIGDLCDVYKSTLSNTIREFCKVVRTLFQPIFMQTPNKSQFRTFGF